MSFVMLWYHVQKTQLGWQDIISYVMSRRLSCDVMMLCHVWCHAVMSRRLSCDVMMLCHVWCHDVMSRRLSCEDLLERDRQPQVGLDLSIEYIFLETGHIFWQISTTPHTVSHDHPNPFCPKKLIIMKIFLSYTSFSFFVPPKEVLWISMLIGLPLTI